jgi:S1-C subfamily serine protease
MSILVECSACNGQFRVDEMHAGKRIRCPGCQGVIGVPTASRPTTPARQEPVRPASPAPRKPSTPASRPQSDSRRRGRAYEAPSVRRPTDPGRYTKASTPAWQIMLISAGAVVALGLGGIVLFSLMRGTGAGPDLAQTDTGAERSTASDRSDVQRAEAGQEAKVSDLATATADPVAGSSSTFIGGITPGGSSVSVAPSTGNQPLPAVGSTPASNVVASAIDATSVSPSVIPTPTQPVAAVGNTSEAPPGTAVAAPSTVLAVSETDLSIDELFSRVEGSVVRVNVASGEGAGNGSGFVIDAAGIVVTNYHVIAGANRAWVEFANKDRVDVDGFLFIDHKKDIAILKFDATRCSSPLASIPVAPGQPRKGIAVVAIGAPLGLDMSVTEGIVSAVRTAKELEESIDLTGHSGTWVQTTAAISPGNSGGPLITKRGEVVAINTLALVGAGAQALNFGISGEDIRQAMTELEDRPIPLSPLSAPEMDKSEGPGTSSAGGIHDASGTPQGDKLLAELRKLVIVFLPLTFNDPQQTVISAVRSEARQTLEKTGIEESLISNDKAALLLLMKLERSGNRLVLYVTAHIIVQDGSSGRPQDVKIWERTGEVGSISMQSILSGNLPANLRKEIKDFFAKMRADILKARKSTAATTN